MEIQNTLCSITCIGTSPWYTRITNEGLIERQPEYLGRIWGAVSFTYESKRRYSCSNPWRTNDAFIRTPGKGYIRRKPSQLFFSCSLCTSIFIYDNLSGRKLHVLNGHKTLDIQLKLWCIKMNRLHLCRQKASDGKIQGAIRIYRCNFVVALHAAIKDDNVCNQIPELTAECLIMERSNRHKNRPIPLKL